ncbi:MAG: beta-galactosidase, partial [Bacteroidetes bacterium]|nr:beta-galactosidase [Bacteroidota bacterium]
MRKSKQRFLFRLSTVILVLNIITSFANAQQGSNDHIFPAATNAKPFIDFDSKGFLINGKRTFIVSAGIEYARVPHELWEDRLLRLKRCGFNCVEIYTFWNFHEPHEGEFDFNGDHDLDVFLKLAHKLNLYVIARVGPYYCAEWDNGGYPLWLKFKPGVRVREHNTEFEKYVGRFFDKLLPIVFRNQINHGGSVIMVQLENEHNQSWGTYIPNGYFSFLRDKALSLGLEVPYFFSGLHHSSSPAEDGKCDDPNRPNPWFSTEFWSVWFSGYSSTDRDAREYERRTWKIITNGGNGYNYYMAHGGSNFGYTNNDEDAASYDYGAAVGQCGDLRPIYYSFKKIAFFARTFREILENSTNADEKYKTI